MIAYEPLWAFNTGKIASGDQIQEAIETVHGWVNENCTPDVAKSMRVLYGGPVTESNTKSIIKLKGVDGFLIGSTSCKPVFRNIFEMVHDHALKDSQ